MLEVVVTVTPLSCAPTAVRVAPLLAAVHSMKIVAVVAADAMLKDVAVVPPDDVENTHVPLELTVNDRSNPELAVVTVSVAVVADHTDTTKEPPSAPPVSVICELCTAKAADVFVTPVSTLPVAVTVVELLDAEHCT